MSIQHIAVTLGRTNYRSYVKQFTSMDVEDTLVIKHNQGCGRAGIQYGSCSFKLEPNAKRWVVKVEIPLMKIKVACHVSRENYPDGKKKVFPKKLYSLVSSCCLFQIQIRGLKVTLHRFYH